MRGPVDAHRVVRISVRPGQRATCSICGKPAQGVKVPGTRGTRLIHLK